MYCALTSDFVSHSNKYRLQFEFQIQFETNLPWKHVRYWAGSESRMMSDSPPAALNAIVTQ